MRTIKGFALRLGTVVLCAQIALFLLNTVGTDLTFYPQGADNSLLATAGKAIRFLLVPVGIDDWRYSVAMLSGVFAKEGVASTLAYLFPEGMSLPLPSALALVVFAYIYTPCVSALASISRAISRKTALFVALWQLFAALVLSYATYFIVNIFILL